MKKYISYLLASALLAPVFVSCNERLQEEEIPVRTHKVLFSASQAETRTGLSIEGKTVTPDWNKTDESSIHLFETDANNATVYGETLIIKMTSDKETAQFEADFPENMTIAVGVNDDTSTGGSAARVAPYSYTAVVAQKAAGETLAFVIPAEQHPDAETLKDPNADFLVGYGAEKVDAPHNYDEPVVDLYFDRAAAMGRVAISNFFDNGEKVQSVTISTTAGLTGSAGLSAIDFEKATVSFTRTEGPLSLVYDNGADVPADGTFYAYFVAIPGEATISSIEVVTDQYVYTKEINKATTLSAKTFKNFTLDLSTAEKQSVAPAVPTYVKVTSTADLEVGGQYILVYETSSKAFKPILASGATYFTKSTANALDVTISNGEIQSSDLGDCLITLEEGYYLYVESVDKYLYPGASGDSALGAEDKTTDHTVAISFNNGIVTIARSNDSNYHLYWSSSNYFSGINSNSSSYAANICLYKLDDGRQKQSPSFTADSAEYDLYTGKWTKEVPTLNDARGTVTYESSDPAVAAVDASTGAVTPIKKGTATITAKAAGNATYRPGEASYTVKVVSSDPSVPSYTKVTSTSELEAGAQYLLVFEGLAGDTDGDGDPKAYNPTLNDGGTQFNKDKACAVDVAISDHTISSADLGDCHFTLEDGYYLKSDKLGKYIVPSGTSNSSGTITAESSASTKLEITFDSGIVKIKATSGTFYLVWSTSNHYFSSNSSVSGSYSTGICLYKLDDGRQKQSPSFSAESAEYDLYKKEWTKAVPTLNGAQGTVTYESSDPTVAAVDASTGAVTPITKGTATITAKAAGNATYRPGEASYTVTVVNSDPAVTSYTKVTSTSDLEAGAQYLLVFEGLSGDTDGDGDPKVFNPVLSADGTLFEKTTSSAVAVTLSNGVIESNDFDGCQFTLEEGYYLKADKVNKYIYPKQQSGTGGVMGAEETATNQLAISFTSAGIVEIKCDSRYLVWSTSSHYFSSNSSTSSTSATGICLYKLDDGRQKQTLSFNGSSARYDKGTSTWTVPVPTLSGAQTDVTFSSSNENVATVTKVSNTTVTVTIASGAKKNDTAVITATAEGTETYKSASASFTVTVDDSNSKTPTYVKAEAIEDGVEYLIVSNGYLLKNSSNSAAAVDVSGSLNGDVLEYDPETSELWTAAASSGKFTFKNDSRYLYRSSTNFSLNTSSSVTWSLTSGSLTTAGSSSTYYLYYSTGNSKWSVSTTASESHTATLYKQSSSSTVPSEPPVTPTYTKVSEITSGGTYLIVSTDSGNYNNKGQKTVFAGNQDGTAVEVDGTSGTITGNYSAYEFVITKKNSDYVLNGPNGYVTGNSATTYSRYIQVSSSEVTMSLTTASDLKSADSGDGKVSDAFYFYYTKDSSKEVLYLNSDGKYKIGGTGRKYGVYLYKKN